MCALQELLRRAPLFVHVSVIHSEGHREDCAYVFVVPPASGWWHWPADAVGTYEPESTDDTGVRVDRARLSHPGTALT